MDEVEKIYNAFKKTDKTLVFTSETVARAALLGFIEKYPGKAVFKDRAISWDRFLLSLLDTKDKKSVTKTERKLFSYSFLKKGGFETLQWFVSPDYRESILSYASYIASLLPFFPSPDAPIRSHMESAMLGDMDAIRRCYIQYLDKNGLYEKNYLTPDYSLIEKDKFIFVFPGTFKSNITKKILSLGLVETIEREEDDKIVLNEYENSLSEIRWTMRQIEKDREIYSDDDIAITSSSLSLYRPYLESEALKRDIPLIFTSSTSLKNYPEGRFLHSLYSSYKESFSFNEMKRLLLNPEFPFRDRDKYVAVLREAVERKMNESWKCALSKDNADIMLGLIYDIEKIVKSRKASVTLSYIKDFREHYFIDGEWNEKDDPVFGSALDLLYKIGDEGTDDLYPLFLSLIDETEYVERSEMKKGIRVYAYPASAGLITKVHYVIGLDDRTTEMKIDDYPFLTSSSRDDIPDISHEVLSTYRRQVFTEKLVISGTSLSFDGARLLPPLFLDSSRMVRRTIDDAYASEKALWFEGVKSEIKPYKKQSESYRNAIKTSLKGRKREVRLTPFSDLALSFSVSKIKDYDACPFRGFVSSRLCLDEKDYSVVLDDARVTGEILHSTIERAIEEYRTLCDIPPEKEELIFLDEIEKAEKKGKITAKYVSKYITGKYIDKLVRTSSTARAGLYSAYSLVSNEVRTSGYPLIGNITINGRVDTLLTDENGGLYIIDWKTGGKNDYSSKSLSDTSLQVILYAILLDKEKVKGGAFYSFSDGDYKVVWPVESYSSSNGHKYEEGFPKEEVIKNAEERLEKIKRTLTEGSFTPVYSPKGCTYCPYSRLCRAKFVSSMEETND